MSAWDQGWATGERLAEQRAAHRQMLSDEERETHLADYNNTIQALQSKLTTAQATGDQTALAGYQNQLSQVVADRTRLFHPENGAGALAHLGRMLWNHVHGPSEAKLEVSQPVESGATLPAVGGPLTTTALPAEAALPAGGAPGMVPPSQRQAVPARPATPATPSETMPGMKSDATRIAAPTGPQIAHPKPTPAELKARMAQEIGWGAPVDPLQEAGRLAEFNRTQQGATQEWQIDWAKRHGISGEALDELTQRIAGVPTMKTPKPLTGAKPYEGADGRFYISAQDPATGEIVALAEPPDFVPPPASTSNMATQRAEYAASIGKSPAQMTFDDETNFIASVHQAASPDVTGSRGGIAYDAEGNPYSVTYSSSTRRTFPGAGGARPEHGSTSVQGTPSVASSAGDLKRRVAGVRSSSGGVTVGAELPSIHRNTPAQAGADKDVVTATKLDSLANQAAATREPGQQKQLALALIKAMAGRVNMQEYGVYTKGYGVENTIDGLIQGIENGGLAPGVLDQLVNDAHANLAAAKAAASATRGPNAGGPSTATKGRRSLAAAMALPINRGKTADEVTKDMQAHGYEVAP